MSNDAVRGSTEPKAPGALLMLLEGRAPWEFAASLAVNPWLARLLKSGPGDGHAVLVFPGLAVGDFSTWPLRHFLREQGYAPYPWGLGANRGPEALPRCIQLARSISEQHGGPISLLGWSLGGIYAREVAKALPDRTRCVITLGTPFAGHPRSTNAWRLYEFLSRQAPDAATLARVREAPPVPTTSIYSKSDGIVAWECSLNADGPLVENICIQASHFGMGANPLALYVIADRLAQDPARWQRFDANGLKRWFFDTRAALA